MSNQQLPPYDSIRAVVGKVFDDYVVAYPEEECGDLRVIDSITFSLSNWTGNREPQVQQVVLLGDVALYARGWRALSASPIVPQRDEKFSNQHSAGRSP